MGYTVALPSLDVKGARPRAVKQLVFAVYLTRKKEGRKEGCRFAPSLAEALLSRCEIRVGKSERQPIVGIEQVGNGISVIGKKRALARMVAGTICFVARISFGNGAARMAMLVKVGHDPTDPFVMLRLTRDLVEHGKGEQKPAVLFRLAGLAVGFGVVRHKEGKTALGDLRYRLSPPAR